MAAVHVEIPSGVLAHPTPEQGRRLRSLVVALAGTRTGEVREILELLAARFPHEPSGRRASKALAAGGMGGAAASAGGAGVSLSGDLTVFGLPTLLQNLGDSRVTGLLTLHDSGGHLAASIEFERGNVVSLRYGALLGPEAVYQLLERPFRGTFAFVHRAPAEPRGQR